MSASAEEALSSEALRVLDRAKPLSRGEQLHIARELHDHAWFYEDDDREAYENLSWCDTE